jgi:PAS domain S-box-containing protein
VRRNSSQPLRHQTQAFDDFTIDLNGVIVGARFSANPITGYSLNELIGKSISIFYDEEDNQKEVFKSHLAKVNDSTEFTTFGYCQSRIGRSFFARLDFYVFRDAIQVPIGYRLTVTAADRNHTSHFVNEGQQQKFLKLSVPTATGYVFIDFKEIIRCESAANSSVFHLVDGSKIIVSNATSQFEYFLNSANFVRIHKCHIINTAHLKSYSRAEGGIVILTDNCHLPLSRPFKPDFLVRLNLVET